MNEIVKVPCEVFINGSRVYVDKDGEVKTELSKAIQESGYMEPEEARRILHAFIDMLGKIG